MTLEQLKLENINMKNKLTETKNELEFYKSIFKSNRNSAIFNLRIKTINGNKIWIDKVLDNPNRDLLLSLDRDDEIDEWLRPIKCER